MISCTVYILWKKTNKKKEMSCVFSPKVNFMGTKFRRIVDLGKFWSQKKQKNMLIFNAIIRFRWSFRCVLTYREIAFFFKSVNNRKTTRWYSWMFLLRMTKIHDFYNIFFALRHLWIISSEIPQFNFQRINA